MITAEKLSTLTQFSAAALSRAVQTRGYKGTAFKAARFVGITNGGQFCYYAVYHVEGGTDSTKIFLTYDHAEDRVIADYHLTELF